MDDPRFGDERGPSVNAGHLPGVVYC